MDFGLESNAIEQDIISDMKQYFPPDTPEEDILELYRNPDKFQAYINQLETYYAEEYKNYSIYNQCIIPVLEQSFASIWVLLFLCLVLRLLCITKLPRNTIHVISFIFGCISLWKFYEGDMVYVLVPAVITMLLCKLVRIPGLLLTVMAGSLMLASENYFLSPIVWTKIKGSVMMISMKIISISFDEESGDPDKVIPFLEYFGYVFNPASVIFGPFITHLTYQQMFMHSNISLNWLFNCCQVLVTAVACLLWSSCGSSNYLANIEDYVPGLRGNRWWKAYQEAQQFRFSHYFSCYLSEASILLVGIGTLTPNVKSSKENKKKKEQTIQWRSPVTSLMMVEFPRSLVDVVTNWNLPVHYWLKQYIFKSTRKYGVFAAILITYVASSMLHAFNFQLSAVLLSIGVFAYVEASFRHLLAVWFNACIEARKCRGKCTHKYNKNNFFVMAVNLMFSMVAVWNLAYLGCLFDASEEEDKGYSMKHALKKWQGYNYTNHLVMLVVLVFQKLSGLFVRTD